MSRLRISGLIHTLARLIEEAGTLGLPVTEIALRTALVMCHQETDSSPETAEPRLPMARAMIH